MKTKILLLISAIFIFFSSCEDVLDRPQLENLDDNIDWKNENNVRLFMNEYYPYFFTGYNTAFRNDFTPVRGYTFSDDLMTAAKQTGFNLNIPASVGSGNPTSNPPEWLTQYTGPTWYFGWIRKSNLALNRIETRMGNILNDEQKKHWTGVARFFRAFNYSNLVEVFGDVPYYNRLIEYTEINELYKNRTPRNEVMDSVYNDFKYAMANVRLNDGDQYVNRYVVAGYISRLMLIEGTWQKYHYNDHVRAKKFLEFSKEASEYLVNSSKYDIVTDFRSLFGSEDLSGNRDCVFYRHYSSNKSITHSVASYSNLNESLAAGANLALLKSFICNDGNPWQNSTVANADSFNIANLIKTRDPRFEATFHDQLRSQAVSSAIYATKFISREGTSFGGSGLPSRFTSANNTNDYPIIRYSEILLNWIEAKAELATIGGAAVSQGDIDMSINKIRNRPLDLVAIGKGVKKTTPLNLAAIPNDPARDADVPALIWEIRRERRMEFFLEHSRIADLRRWKKISYMNGTKYPDILKSVWVNIQAELPGLLTKSNVGKVSVIKADGTRVTYDGTNGAALVGFFSPAAVVDREPFENIGGVNVYLAPIGLNQINDYQAKGFVLNQTAGWGE